MTATPTSATETAIPEGSLVATTDTSLVLPWWRAEEYQANMQGIVESYVPAEETDDGHAFYWVAVSGRWPAGVPVAAEHVRLLRTRDQIKDSRIPSANRFAEDLAEDLAEALLRRGDGYEVTDTERDEREQTVTLYGRTDAGRAFSARVTVEETLSLDS